QIPGEELGERRNARLPAPEEPDSGAAEFFFRLEEVPAVRPEARHLVRDQHIAGRTGESADPGASLPALGDVLALMRIAARDEIRLHLVLLHQATHRLDPLLDLHTSSFFSPGEGWNAGV